MANEWDWLGLLASLVDVAGSVIIAGSTVRALIRFLGQGGSAAVADQAKGQLASDLVTALSFKSGAGLIRTITVGSWSKLSLVLAIISLRFLLGKTLKLVSARDRPAEQPPKAI